MHKIESIILFFLLLLSCSQIKEQPLQYYEPQIGDTPFDIEKDDPNFKFCDASDVLHKRAFVRYEGGMKGLNEEIVQKYEAKPSYASYSGYFIIRFAVNCNDEAGRFRMQIFDTNFILSTCPPELEAHILSIIKGLKGWKHPFYDNKDYDGYKFITIKIIGGQIK